MLTIGMTHWRNLMTVTPVHKFGGIYVKREDLAAYVGYQYPSGSKVRQYNKMVQAADKDAELVVGCASSSAMQIYVAAAAAQNSRRAVVFVPARKERTSATEYAIALGAEIHEVRPGYMNVVRARAREYGKGKKVVRWDVMGAVEDAAAQVTNIPDVKRIVVASGSGLTAVGIAVGLARQERQIPLEIIATSNLVTVGSILGLYFKAMNTPWMTTPVEFAVRRADSRYEAPHLQRLPDGTPLDPFYGAKAWEFCKEGDLLWTPGLRPVVSMPRKCQEEFRDWRVTG